MVQNSPYSNALRDWVSAKVRGDQDAMDRAAAILNETCRPSRYDGIWAALALALVIAAVVLYLW